MRLRRLLARGLPPGCFRVVSRVPQVVSWVPLNGFTGRTSELRPPWRTPAITNRRDRLICRRYRRDVRRIRVKSEKPDKILEIVGLLLLERGAGVGLMDRVVSSQENARGHGKEFPVIFQDVCILAVHLLALGLTVKQLDAPVFKSIG